MSETGAFMPKRRQSRQMHLTFGDFTWVDAPRSPRRGSRARDGADPDRLIERGAPVHAGGYPETRIERRMRAESLPSRTHGQRIGADRSVTLRADAGSGQGVVLEGQAEPGQGLPLQLEAQPGHGLPLSLEAEPGLDVSLGLKPEPGLNRSAAFEPEPGFPLPDAHPARRSASIPARRSAPLVVVRSSPDRIALWAVVLGIVLLLIAAASAHGAILRAGSGRAVHVRPAAGAQARVLAGAPWPPVGSGWGAR